MPWGAAIAAVGAVGAAAISSKGAKAGAQQSSDGSSQSAPWSAQQPYLQQGFQNAQNIYGQQSSAGAYPGQYYAPTNGTQNAAATVAGNFANTSNIPGQLSGASSNGLNAQGSYIGNASAMAANGTPGINQGNQNVLSGYAQGGNLAGVHTVDGGLSSALNQAGTNGANAINGFNTGLSGAAQTAAQDPTQRLASDAGMYMNSGPVQQSIAATNAQINQTLNEQTLPGLNRQAAMGGDLNSSRAGAANAQAQQGAAMAEGSADASIYNNAYNSGLSTANSSYATGLGAQISANSSGLNSNANLAQGQQNYQLGQQQQETGARLGAANSALGNQLGYNSLTAQTQLGANAQLGNSVSQGITSGIASGTAAQGDFSLGQAAGQVGQTNQQQLNNQALLQWQQENGGAAMTANQNFMGQIQGNYGTTGSTQSTVQNPYSPTSNALGALTTGAGLYKNNQSSFDAAGNWIGNQFGSGNNQASTGQSISQATAPVDYGPYIGAPAPTTV